ncbi:hypothetical protein CSC82_06820 [Rhodobacteraceae bacterium 4F10]|nr:hypothetical protein CSC82_06820 [Rhodobacteraceae bacterium 4F10]
MGAALVLSGCMSDAGKPDYFSPEGKQALADAYLNAENPDKSTPVVRSGSTLNKYANLFQEACLKTLPSFGGASEVFQKAGMRQVVVANHVPSIVGYMDNTEANRAQMSEQYADLAVKLKRPNGEIPLITGFDTVAEGRKVFTDGVAVAEVSVARNINDGCSVRIKTSDDNVMLKELQRVVNETGLATGAPANTGLFGMGYVLNKKPQTMLTVGRGHRSSHSPTRYSALVLNKR